MRTRLWVAVVSVVGACSGSTSVEADTAAVYQSLLGDYCCADKVILQEVTDSVGLAPREPARPADPELDRFSDEIREAVADLHRRSASVRPLPDSLQVAWRQQRVSADSARALLERIERDRIRRLPDTASVVLVSSVGFSRDRTVAVVRIMDVCGYLCGGVTLRAVRRHPGGWVLAEEVRRVVF